MKVVANYLYQNPTATHNVVAQETHLTPAQVKHCLDELRREGHITHRYEVDPDYLGYELLYRVDIVIIPSKLREGHGGLEGDKARVESQKSLARYILNDLPNNEQFKGKILVQDVQILLGHPADLSATVRAVNSDAMLEFVTEGLRMCQAISQTTSCLEAWSCRGGF